MYSGNKNIKNKFLIKQYFALYTYTHTILLAFYCPMAKFGSLSVTVGDTSATQFQSLSSQCLYSFFQHEPCLEPRNSVFKPTFQMNLILADFFQYLSGKVNLVI